MAAITGTGSCRHPHTACCGKLARPWVRAVKSRLSPPAIPLPPPSFMAAKRPMSRPAQNERPSPENTSARNPFSRLRRSLAATSASNIAASRAFILSARTRRTSATPSEIDTETRSSINVLPALVLCNDFTERRSPDLVNQLINKQSSRAETSDVQRASPRRPAHSCHRRRYRPRQVDGHALPSTRRRGSYLRPAQRRLRRNRDRTDGPAWRPGDEPRRRHPKPARGRRNDRGDFQRRPAY